MPTETTTAPAFLDALWSDLQQLVTIDAVMARLQAWGPRILSALAVFVIGRICAKLLTSMLMRGATRAKLDETLSRFASNVVYILLLTTVSIAALGCLGVDTTSLSAVLAAAGFAIGMALQASLGNIASGVLLVFFKPFRVGDFVELGGIRGKVVEIQIFSTILVTADNVRMIVPNASITNGTIQNFSAEQKRRIDLIVSCGYHDDLRAVKLFLQQLMLSDSRILSDPAPVVAVSELADSGVNMVVRPWVAGRDYWDVRFALTEAIKLGFDERGFTIPFPSRDVFVHQAEPYSQLVVNESSAFAA
ncbi:MAG: mechanosensitive ion channel [Planctomyces sp.]|nr:mechanosensitive ion channel [Planctomyces sp.]